VQDAARYGREGAALFRELGRPQFAEFCLPYLAIALALGGHLGEANETLSVLDALRGPTFFMGVDPLQARAWAAVAEGDIPAARELLNEAVTVAEHIGDLVGKAEAIHGLARLGQAAEVTDDLSRLAKTIEGDIVPARAAHCRALADRNADALFEVCGDFEAMGSDLLAAEAATDAAVAWRSGGDTRQAAAAERRAETLTQRIQGATTPALQAVGFRASLTRVERETAVLAAAGRSSKDIADSLFVSVRTIEGRLLRIYQKLGISSRAELAEFLSPKGHEPAVPEKTRTRYA
jgi:DNA-binding CsgD family transcriptional regulator